MLIDADENVTTAHAEKHKGHWLLKASLAALLLWPLLAAFGVGVYRNTSGDRSFDLWYLIVYMLIALVVMHEFIAPMPPKERAG
jgi:predicted branched-subunit amino acid permease